MHAHETIVDLATTAQPLPAGRHGMVTALGRPRLVETPDGLGVRMFAGDETLALVAHACLIPLDGLDEPL
jgi:hypothetical protein